MPHFCKAAGKEGGQLVTTPRGSPCRGLICWPSGVGWLGSGCWTETKEQRDKSFKEGGPVSLWSVKVHLNNKCKHNGKTEGEIKQI